MRLAECPSAMEGSSSAWKTRGSRPFCRPNPLNLLRDPKLVTFTRDLLIYKASKVMPDLEMEEVSSVSQFVDRLFAEAGKWEDPVEAGVHLNRTFGFDDQEGKFWRAQRGLKNEMKNRRLIEQEQLYKDCFFLPPTVLDVGTGGGFLEGLDARHPSKFSRLIGTSVAKKGPWSCWKAPFEFVYQEDQRFPLEKIGSGSIHAANMTDVLHHIYPECVDPQNEKTLLLVGQFLEDLYEAMADGGRAIIIEESFPEVYDEAFRAAPEIEESQEKRWAQRFLQLSVEQRYQFLMWDDWFWAVVYGVIDYADPVYRMPYRYFTMEQWIDLFQSAGFLVKEAQYWGCRSIYLLSSNEVFFVLEK